MVAFTQTPSEVVIGEQALRNRAAEALERAVRALLGDQRDELADLRIVHGVLNRVGNRGVGLTDLQAQVEHQSLADLALSVANAVVGVQRRRRSRP